MRTWTTTDGYPTRNDGARVDRSPPSHPRFSSDGADSNRDLSTNSHGGDFVISYTYLIRASVCALVVLFATAASNAQELPPSETPNAKLLPPVESPAAPVEASKNAWLTNPPYRGT